ncbi:BTB/POZ domain-containing protein 6-like isoform X1 [Plodia interpunctella]|uniref:BTB/POZ domain-containing protein 6-like isoform X1 n=1 Tax=Plodia interpunctella TaxID=58824 RepID=UPI0023684E77|nr:BTB/POZ domain-containing protein 6-like isoform X1 [Plodia interpunctella]
MAKAQIEEDWQSKCGTAKERGSYLLQTESWSDCKFRVGQQVKVYFSAHKLILASSSRVFEAMFYGDLAETRDVIDITDIQPEAFKAMLEYIYTDVLKLKTCDEACALYQCADKYNLKRLCEGCVKFLLSNVKPENVCQIFEFAKMYNEQGLIDKTIQIIHAHTPEVLNSNAFFESKPSTVVDIFSQQILNIKSEIELFDAAERYANSYGDIAESNNGNNRKRKLFEHVSPKNERDINCEKIVDDSRSSSLSSGSSSLSSDGMFISQQNNIEIDDNKKEVFRHIVSKILFLTMTAEQFANRVVQSPYMTQDDCYGLIMNIVSETTNVPFPLGFCGYRRPRYKLITESDSHVDHTPNKAPTRPEAIFAVTVPTFKQYRHVSKPFYVRNMKWRVAVDPQPNINDPKQMVLGINLMAVYPHKPTFTCSAEVELGIALTLKPNTHHVLKKTTHLFTMKSKYVGAMIPFNDNLFDPSIGCVKNNSITIIVKIKANEVIGV